MNRKEQVQSLKSEIESTLKKWSEQAEQLGTDIISSVSLEDHESTGCHFMQSICGHPLIVIQNLCAILERVPKEIKVNYMNRIFESLMAIDEETELSFRN